VNSAGSRSLQKRYNILVEKIVVGIDGSNVSKDALRWAVEDARARGAEVVALHAYEVPEPPADPTPVAPLNFPELLTEAHAYAQQLVTDVVDEVAGKAVTVDVAPIAVEDTPAKALLDAARDADLLVVGSHGHGLSGLFLGSVSLECAQHAACPVVIFRSSTQDARPTASND
jgi:nucleotide-binding universal stress UspA family protein